MATRRRSIRVGVRLRPADGVAAWRVDGSAVVECPRQDAYASQQRAPRVFRFDVEDVARQWLMCEPPLDGEFRKFNSNAGWADASDDAEVDAEDEPPNDSRLSDVVPLQDTPYGAVVYLPKRDSFAGKRERKP